MKASLFVVGVVRVWFNSYRMSVVPARGVVDQLEDLASQDWVQDDVFLQPSNSALKYTPSPCSLSW
jgi:hypothetical protein